MISIIILNYRSEELCHKCLDSIFKNPPKEEFEIFLVDNYSGDDSLENIRKRWQGKEISFIEAEKNLGYGMGNMLGIKKAKGDLIAIVNPDIEVGKEVFEGLSRYMRSKINVGIIAPKIYYPDGSPQDSFRRFPTFTDLFIKRFNGLFGNFFHKRLAKFLMWDVDFLKPLEVDWVVGAFMIINKKAFDEIGGFDRRYFLFFEDTDLCRSMWNNGWKVVFNPDFQVIHNHTRLSETESFWDFFRKKTVRIHIASALKYFWKWKFKPTRPQESLDGLPLCE